MFSSILCHLNLKHSDYFALLVANLLAYLITDQCLPATDWAPAATVFIAYNLFICWLFFAADDESGRSFGLGYTLVSHAAFVAIAMAITYYSSRHFLSPMAMLKVRVPVLALAIFEKGWLFTKNSAYKSNENPKKSQEFLEANAEEYGQWMNYLYAQKPPFPRPGKTVEKEFSIWHHSYYVPAQRVAQQEAARAAATAAPPALAEAEAVAQADS